jgi:hypothetical protein
MRNFKAPTSLREATNRISTLEGDCENIEKQLAERKEPRDTRMPPHLFHEWKRKAERALKWKRREVEFLQRQIEEEDLDDSNMDIGDTPEAFYAEDERRPQRSRNNGDTDSLLKEAFFVMKELGKALDWDVNERQQRVIDEVKDYLEDKGVLKKKSART